MSLRSFGRLLYLLGLAPLVRLFECVVAYRTGRRPRVAVAAGWLAGLAQVSGLSTGVALLCALWVGCPARPAAANEPAVRHGR